MNKLPHLQCHHTFPGLRLPASARNLLLVASLSAMSMGQLQAFDLTVNLKDENGGLVSQAVIEAQLLPATPDTSAVATMDQIERRFVPMVLLIAQGQQVNFPNSDNVRHHVYSFSDIKQFSTPLYADEAIAPVRFETPGVAVLGCNIHDSMVAYVYVSAWQDTTTTDETGQARLSNMSENPQTLTIWHPWLQTPDNTYTVDVSAYESGARLDLTLPVVDPQQQFGFRALLPGGAP